MLTRIITEGRTKIEVPVPEESSSFPPSSAAVFYNPAMRSNRDMTVAAVACFSRSSDHTYLDALSASGIRGLRIANEVGLSTTMNDWDEIAFDLITKNIALNNLSNCTAIKRNANMVMLDSSFDIIDLDPFGSPVPFLDATCRSAKLLLCITATDTAPLCGAHRKAGIRNYAAVPLKTEYYPEMGVRILMGAVARTLARYDKAMVPLLSCARAHYVRLFVSVKKGIREADDCMKSMGFVSHCFGCGAHGDVIRWMTDQRGLSFMDAVKELASGEVHITSQNHGYAVDGARLSTDAQVTHLSLNDGTVEGLRHKRLPVLSIQYHSEASPGPRDNVYIFDRLLELVR